MANDNPHHQPQDWWQPNVRDISAHMITRYSRLVGSLKLILPIAAACILVVLVVVPNVNGSNIQPKKLNALDSSMVDPVYTSRDSENRPYEVTADTAKQTPDTPGITNLANPKAVIDLNNGAKLNAEGQGATYNEKDGTLNVQKGVVLRHSDGTTFTTDEAHIDMNTKNAQGDKPVTLQGNFGEVHGEGFKTLDGGKTVIFTGRSTATLKMGGSAPGNTAVMPGQTPSAPQNKAVVPQGLPSTGKPDHNAPTSSPATHP